VDEQMPSYLVDESGGSLAGLLWKLNQLCPERLQEWVYNVLKESISEHVAPSTDKRSFLSSVCTPHDKDDFVVMVRKFGRRCRDNARRWQTAHGGGG
jgi:hypothetical protein